MKEKHTLQGLTVNIYRQPLTRQQFEGAARVMKVITVDKESCLVRCKVKFKQDGLVGERFIYSPTNKFFFELFRIS